MGLGTEARVILGGLACGLVNLLICVFCRLCLRGGRCGECERVNRRAGRSVASAIRA